MGTSDVEVQSRLKASLRTPTGAFSQVVALSQKAVNAALFHLPDIYPELATIKFEAHDGTMDAKVGAPQVAFEVDSNNRSSLLYYCSFASGKMTLWNSDLNDFSSNIDIKGWQFVFSVDLGKMIVEKNSDDEKEIKSVMDQAGDYSITRLYMDFNTSRISNYRDDLSDFKGYGFPSDEHDSFLSLMLRWANPKTGHMGDPKKTTIGFAASTAYPESVNTDAPSFPPTALMFQTYQFLSPGSNKPTVGLVEGKRNMLLYLNMTQHKDFPIERYLDYSGNIVPSTIDGSICIGKDIFWNSYLVRNDLPLLLNVLNKVTFAWVKSVSIDYNGFKASYSADYGVGPGSGLDDAKEFYTWDAVDDLNWKWTQKPHKYDDMGWGGVFDGSTEMWCNTDNLMRFTPGTNAVAISGQTQMKLKMNTHSFGIGEGFESSATMTWKLTATLESVYQGGLQILLDLKTKKDDAFQIWTYENSWPLGAHSGEAKKMQTGLQNSIASNTLDQAEQTLQTALEKTARFVLPGAGVFLYKNPIFNNHGDFLCDVEYNGV